MSGYDASVNALKTDLRVTFCKGRLSTAGGRYTLKKSIFSLKFGYEGDLGRSQKPLKF